MIRPSRVRRTAITICFALAAFEILAHGEGAAEDAFDRPISLIMPRAPLDHFCKEVSKQLEIPVEIQRRELMAAGLMGSFVLGLEADQEPAGRLLWRSVLQLGQRNLVFVARRDARGAIERIEFTSLEHAREKELPLPYEARFLPAILPELRRESTWKGVQAAMQLARFGTEAEGAVPDLQTFLKREDLDEVQRSITNRVLLHIRKCIRERERLSKPAVKAPPRGDWLSIPITLPRRACVVDELCESVAEETGVPLVLRFDDFAREDRLVADYVEVEAKEEPLGAVLWRTALKQNLVVVLHRDSKGEAERLELTTPLAIWRRRGDATAIGGPAAEAVARGVLPLLDDPRDDLVARTLELLQALGPAAQSAEAKLAAMSDSDGRARRVLKNIRAAVEADRRRAVKQAP